MTIRPLCIALALLGAAPHLAADWRSWNGPNHDLTVAADVFEQDSFGLEVVWKKDLGAAYSRIGVADGRVVTAFSDGTDDFLVALSASEGEELWRYRIAETYKGHDGSEDGPLSTPVLYRDEELGEIVYGLGPFGHLFAVEADDGKAIWATKLDEEIGYKPEYGFTTVPLVADDLLIVQGGGKSAKVAAFDRKTGELRWSAVEEGKVAYESPILLERDGKQQIVAVTDRQFIGLNPADGAVLWTYSYSESGEYGGFAHPVPIGGDKFLFTTWSETVLLDLSGEQASEIWRSRHLSKTYAFPVPHDGYAYGFNGNFLSAIDLETGEKVWKSRPPGGGHLILVDDHLVIQTEKGGELVIVEATPEEYREKARLKSLEVGNFVGPTFAEGMIFVRGLKEIVAVRAAEASPGPIPEEAAPSEAAPEESAPGI